MSGDQRIKSAQTVRDFLWRQSWHGVETVIVNGGTPYAGDIEALLATDQPVPPVVRNYLARKRGAGRPKLARFQIDAAQWRRAEELIAEVAKVRRTEKCSLAKAVGICKLSMRHYWRARETSARFRNEADEMVRQAARLGGQSVEEFVEQMLASFERFENPTDKK